MYSPSLQETLEWLDDTGWPDGESGVLAMFRVAVDESGTHENAPVLCVAACVATSTQWKHLISDWMPTVRQLPNGYHAKRGDCREASEALARLIARRCELVVAVTIAEPDYKRLTPDGFRSFFGSAYTIAVLRCMYEISQWCDGQGHKWAKYVFESGHKNQKYTQKLLNLSMETRARYRLLMFSHEWVSKGNPILHAADLVSHEHFSAHVGASNHLLDGVPAFRPTHLDEAEIVRVCDDLWRWKKEYRQNHPTKRWRRV